jgi:hypothetical protein
MRGSNRIKTPLVSSYCMTGTEHPARKHISTDRLLAARMLARIEFIALTSKAG